MKHLLCCNMFLERQKPYIIMIFIQFIYTGMALFSKAAITEGMNPSIFVAYRQGFATLALAPFAFFFESKKPTPLTFMLLCKIFLVSLCGLTLSLNLYYAGLNFVSATFATAMTNTIPAMVFTIAICLRIESLALNQWSGVAKVLGSVVGLSGAMVFTFFKGPPLYPVSEKNLADSSIRTYSKEDWIKGSLLMIAANLTWSMWLTMQAPILKQYPSKLRLTTLQCCFSCIVCSLWGATMDRDISSWKLGWNVNLFSVVYCGIIVTGLTYWLQVWVVDKKGPVFTSVFSPLALILTAIFSAVIFKESLHWGSVCGALLLVVGLYSFLWGKNKESKANTDEQKTDQVKEEVALEYITCTSEATNNQHVTNQVAGH